MFNHTLATALETSARGWRIAPAPHGRKYPAIKGWQDKATTDTSTIIQWWTAQPDANICIATGPESGIFVLDVDDKPGKTGSATLAALEAAHGSLPDTYTVGTGSGGVHLYFSYEGVDFDLKNDAGKKLGKDLDIRGRGGQVVAPPSRADDPTHTMAYTVLVDIPPAAAPAWLLDKLRPQDKKRKPAIMQPGAAGGDYTHLLQPHSIGGSYTTAALEAELARIRTAPDGQGNQTIASAAFNIATLAAAPWSEITPEAARLACHEAVNGWQYRNGADETRMRTTIDRQFDYGMNSPRTTPPKKRQGITTTTRTITTTKRSR